MQFFAVFDGHGGQGCSEFLRDNLHNFIALSPHFPTNLAEAMKEGCARAETIFQKRNLQSVRDKSGSCALVILINENRAIIANVGDSRALLSTNKRIE